MGDTPATLENPERVGVMVGSAFGGMETFEKETLKLAKKPERPKVRTKLDITTCSMSLRLSANNTFLSLFRFHPSQFLPFLETQHLESLELNVDARDQIMELFQPVPVEVTPSEKPWE